MHAVGRVDDDLVGIGHLGEVLALGAGLLALLRSRRTALGRYGAGGLVNPSADGGIEELRGLRPRRSSRSATSACSSAISVACAA